MSFSFFSNPQQAVFSNSAYLPNIPFYEYDDIKAVDFSRTVNRILFVGNLNYGPNIQGLEIFVDKILPFVKEEVPNVEMHIVGGCNNVTLVEKVCAVKGVKYMGFLNDSDLRQEYEYSRVVVAPIYSGAGTNVKVLEAIRMKRPCVTTSYGARGFSGYFTNDKEIAIADNPREFVEKVVMLLREEDVNHAMSEKAYSVVIRSFSRDSFNHIVRKSLLN